MERIADDLGWTPEPFGRYAHRTVHGVRATAPDAATVPVPAYPGSIFAGATPSYTVEANGMLFERPGAVPLVEIGEPFFAGDLKLDPTAVTAVTVYYQPR